MKVVENPEISRFSKFRITTFYRQQEAKHMENYEICHCKKVSYYDVEDAMQDAKELKDVELAFRHVQEETRCSTGCGGCHDKIMDAVSEIMNR